MKPIRKLLVANRGEIAVRVMRSARDLGIATVAVYSDADADAPFVRFADQAVRIGEAPPRSSYLDIDAILDAAARTGADAVHPGYGFLSENAEFAERLAAAGVRLVGPPPQAIRIMGDKVQALRKMIAADVPTLPGYHGDDQVPATLAAEGVRIGVPLLVKATAGGGGRGMRIVRRLEDLEEAIASARREASNAFGRGDVFLERLVEGGRHVEIQVMADQHGRVVHLFERECSAQRRHQKVIEEAPSPAMTPVLRERMGAAAVAAAQAIGYVGAGTVEFLLDDSGAFYFLEMNTRLQVEHPVTEMITGLDLVATQIRVAEGAALPEAVARASMHGHAIEARIYAEDPHAGFLPQLGEVLAWTPAHGPHVRVDHGLRQGQQIGPHYDAMVAKVIAWGEDREQARRRLVAALKDSVLLGPGTNRAFLLALIEDEMFVAGAVKTDTLDRRLAEGWPPRPEPTSRQLAAAAVLHSRGRGDGWSSNAISQWPLTLALGDHRYTLGVTQKAPQSYAVTIGAETIAVEVIAIEAPRARLAFDGIHETVHFAREADALLIDHGGVAFRLEEPAPRSAAAEAADDGAVRAPMGGRVLRVEVATGDRVSAGQTLAIVEAMKMEHRVQAKGAGTITKIAMAVGDQVAARQILATIESEGSPSDVGT